MNEKKQRPTVSFCSDVNVLFVPCCSAMMILWKFSVDALAVLASAITNPINVVHFCLQCESFRVAFTEVKSRNRTSTFMAAK